MQKVNILDETAQCSCGASLTVLGSFIYLGTTVNSPHQKDEQCKCVACGEEFTLHYDFFDDEGHINSFVFNSDVNDPSYNWQDQLTPEQTKEIGEHLLSCRVCGQRLDNEMSSDAWLASLLHNYKK
jgi:hypothetical protein